MKNKILILATALPLAACAGTPAAVLFPVVLGAGAAINIENSGNPIDTPKEALERFASDVKAGYSRDVFVSFDLNE